MKRIQLLKSLLCTLCLCLTPCYAMSIDKLIVFGDSLSDNGNLYSLTSTAHKIMPLVPIIPMDPPYFKGRFSNGYVWVDLLSQLLNVEMENYAYGGAWVESSWYSHQIIPYDLGTQVNFYLNKKDTNQDKHLFVIWAGSNDYVGGRSDAEFATTNTIEILKKQIDWLIYYGAKQFLIFTIPDLSVVPEVVAKGPEFAASVHHLAELHNQKLISMVTEMQTLHPEINIIMHDISDKFNDIVQHPENYHLVNSHDACYRGDYSLMETMASIHEISAANTYQIDIVNNPSLKSAYNTALLHAANVEPCQNPDDYLFWDHIHPTRMVHQIISTVIFDVLTDTNK